jgi:peptidoglycan/LPS O-acetylase OafA/YrhL
MLIALTRAVPPSIVNCELTHLERQPINVALAVVCAISSYYLVEKPFFAIRDEWARRRARRRESGATPG